MDNGMISFYAKQLKMPGFANYQTVVREAEQHGWGYADFLLRIMKNEVAHRQENQRKQKMQQAKFPVIKTLDEFDFKNVPHIDPAVIWQLADCQFLQRKEGIVFCGNPGTGKTHLAIALGLKACERGLRVRFYTAAGLVNDLVEAQQNHTLSKLEQQLNKLQLLILDELSYLTFARPSAELLFQVLSGRNERGSVIITTNLEFSRWTEIFGDPMLTAAVVDRMTHRSHIIDTNGPSYRLRQRLALTETFGGEAQESLEQTNRI
jgi:DNA replication protein DnaC